MPLVCVLDEAANVCRLPDLPDLYSHYGSRGIVVATYLQSWSQGVTVWGRDGMEKLWSAANIRLVGAGVAETEFLQRVSKLIGDRDVVSRSSSSTRGRRTVSAQLRRERILDVARPRLTPTRARGDVRLRKARGAAGHRALDRHALHRPGPRQRALLRRAPQLRPRLTTRRRLSRSSMSRCRHDDTTE
jgi:hypothetical protein